MENSRAGLEVCMLGGFSVRYGGRPISFSKGGRFKSMSLLQLLLIHKKSGIAKDELMRCLYDWEAVSDRNNSLNSLIYRLKRQLIAAGLPEGEYVCLQNGICRWCADMDTWVDFIAMEEMIEEAGQRSLQEQEALLEKACGLYRGEFLPESSGEIWAAAENIRLKGLYTRAVHQLCAIWKEQQEYQKMLELYRMVAELYPYEEWQVYEIDCLMELQRYEKAYSLYRETVKSYSDELGIPPSPRMQEQLQRMGSRLTTKENSLSKVRELLREDEIRGGYFCPYPSFIDTYRFVCRIAERSGQSMFLMLCTLRYTDGAPEKKDDAGTHLRRAMEKSLRRGDVYTKYSSSQYLILLSGIHQEDCGMVYERIRKSFCQTYRNPGCQLEYEAEEIMEISEFYSGNTEKKA